MKKVKVSAGIYKLTASAKVEFARAVVTAMMGNINFPNPTPALSVVINATDALHNAIMLAADRSRLHVLQQHTAQDELNTILAQLALYIENAAGNDANKIISSGMHVKHDASAPHAPAAPSVMSAISNGHEGETELSWHGVPKARVYVVEQSNDTGLVQNKASSFITWAITDIVTKTKLLVTGLTSGCKYAFRVYAITAGGKGFKSTPVIVKVL